MAAVSPSRRAAGLEPLGLPADAHAAGALFEEHSSRVFAYCLSKLGRREDAEDAVQTTYLHAVRGLRRGVVPAVELAWLLGIARNVCLSRRESAGRRGRLELVCDPVDLERTAARQSRRDELIGLQEALARLPEQQRRAVLLRDWRGLSYAEIAEELGVTVANAETLIFRGRRSLAAHLQEQPSAIRRRLGSLANLGSLFTAVKTAFTGAATVAKIAAAVTVVAASGAGVVAGTAALGERSEPPPTTVPAASEPERRAPTPPSPSPVPAPARPTAAAAQPQAATPRTPEAPPRTATPAPAPAPAASPPAAVPASPPPAAPTHAQGPATPAPHTVAPAPTPRPTVQSTVDEVVPDLPVVVPPLPEVVGSLPVPELPLETPAVVETVVAAVPAVTVTPPLLPVAPVTIDPKKLLP